MAQVTVNITGATYIVGCQDGEEGHVQYLTQEVERRLATVRARLAPTNEGHALFLTALLLADEINDLRAGQLTDESRKSLEEARLIIEDHARQEERLQQIADLAEHLLGQIEPLQESEKNAEGKEAEAEIAKSEATPA
ncbi:cell division protein ZapA [Acetobacteraceae bacterium ESL0709]|nr:cell division protein ZapA [Acetobacteraceae bacterium ESL0697]MDF7678514.1 cell division protein ZapA [Acetobacteraceae bacterium ESL0709]